MYQCSDSWLTCVQGPTLIKGSLIDTENYHFMMRKPLRREEEETLSMTKYYLQ